LAGFQVITYGRFWVITEAVDGEIAMRILVAPTRYGESGEGDIKALSGEWDGYFRLRVGDFR